LEEAPRRVQLGEIRWLPVPHSEASKLGQSKSGEPSTQGPKATGERYLPEKAIKALSKKEYAATTAAKRKATKAGKQVAKQPKKIAKKVRPHRKVT
jgi:hypothetical protein